MAHRGAQRKLNSKPAWKKAANILVLLVLLGVFFYISFRVVDKFSIKLFTFHPLFNVFGVRIFLNCEVKSCFNNLFAVLNINVECNSDHG